MLPAGSGSPGAGAEGTRKDGFTPHSPSTPSTRMYASPAKPRPASASPSPAKPLYFSPVPAKTISVLNRPKNPVPSAKNHENLDVQYARDQAAQERHAAVFRRQQGERWHHFGPGTPTILEQGHIVDKGRGRDGLAAKGVFDPILSEFRIPPAEPSSKPARPSSAPPSRGHATLRGDKAVQQAQGVRDPITGVAKPGNQPSPGYAARRQLEFERSTGWRGIACQRKEYAFNPITGEETPLSHAARQQERQQERQQVQQTQKERQRPQSAPRGAVMMNVTRADRPSTPSKRPIHNGTTWGQYNPVTHQWQVPPTDPKFADVSAQVEKTHGLTGSHVRRVPLPARQGVYNPILNTWSVPPEDPHILGGLTFAPATLFVRVTPATLRSPH